MVSKVLEVGWNNVSKQAHYELRNCLEADHKPGAFSLNGEGWMLHVPSNGLSEHEPSLLAALQLTKAKGCTWLIIGFVAKETAELPIYESDKEAVSPQSVLGRPCQPGLRGVDRSGTRRNV